MTGPIERRRTALRSFLGLYSILGCLGVGVWVVGILTEVPVSIPMRIALGLLPLLFGVVYSWLIRLNSEYRLFDDSLEVESGILARRIENIQLFRVRDLGLSQSLLDRMTGVGDVIVTSTDQSAPHFRLRGVEDARGLYERLRELVSKSQATRRTMIVEEER